MTVTFSCDNCGDSVEKYESNTGENVFCGRECYGEFKEDKIIVECENCGSSIRKTNSKANPYSNHFCSKSCQGEYLSDGVDVRCSYCDTPIRKTPFEIKNNQNHFCDQKCWGKWVSEYRIRENASNWRGGHVEDYGPNWDTQRKKTLRRDDWNCLRCGMDVEKHHDIFDKSLIVHHIIPLKVFDRDFDSANDLSNLASVCMKCHMTVEVLSPKEQKEILFGETTGDN